MPIVLPPGIILLVILTLLILYLVVSQLVHRFEKRLPRFSKLMRRYRFRFVIVSLVSIFMVLIIAPVVLKPIRPGEVGVLWRRFAGGTQVNSPFQEGTLFVYPWDNLYIYSGRFQTREINIVAVTSEGLKITLNTAVRFRPLRNSIPLLHKLVGEEYVDRLIIPEVGSSARLVVSAYTAEEVYAKKRDEVQTAIFNSVNSSLSINEYKLTRTKQAPKLSRFIHLEDILIRDVQLPDKVDLAIINKVNQKYLDEEYEIRLEVAKKEARRKQTEAQGIAAFQATVSGGISENYLRWRGIEATLELAKSDNTKIVVVGSGKDGLPLILNADNSLQMREKNDADSDSVYQVGAHNPEAIEIDSGTYREK